MLTVSTMEDEGSSLGTAEDSDTMVVPPAAATAANTRTLTASAGGDTTVTRSDTDEAPSLTNEEEAEWVVTTDGLETQSLNLNNNGGYENDVASSGVLILGGEEPEALSHESGSAGFIGGLDLSADSVPTFVGSIDGLPHPSNAAPTNTTTTATTTPGICETTAPGSSASKAIAEEKQRAAPHSTSTSSKSRLALFLVVPTLALFLVVPTIASIRLYRERNSLLVSVAQLEDEVLSLQKEADRKKKAESLMWNTCGGEGSKETVLLDNCWLSAKANIQLGECANSAKDNVMELSSSLLERLEMLGNSSSWNMDPFAYDGSSIDEVGESVARMMRKVDSLGKALWDATTTKTGTSQGDVPPTTNGSTSSSDDDKNWKASFLSRMETSGKSQWKDTVKEAKSAIFTMFESAEEASSSSSSSPPNNNKKKKQNADTEEPAAFDDVVQGITDILVAAGSLSIAAGEALVATAVEKATAAIDFNQTSMNDLVEVARQAFEEASLTHVVDG